MVKRLDILFITLLVPFLITIGRTRYPFAIGSKTTLSTAWLNENIALLKPSKHSFALLEEDFFNFSLPAEPAYETLAHKRNTVIAVVISFFILFTYN